MKSFLIILTLVTLSLSVYFTYDRYERTGVSTYRMFDGNNELQISSRGKIVFNDDETGVLSLSKKGFLKYKNNDLKVNITEKDGMIEYDISDDGKPYDLNSEDGKKLLAIAIKDMIETGYDARGRAERIYRIAGADSLLSAVSILKQDHIKVTYLDYLLDQPSITDAVYANVILQTASFGSDFEKAKMLKRVSGKLNDSLTTRRYFEVVDGMEADFEKSGVIKNMIKTGPDSSKFLILVGIISRMHADFEKSGLLRDLAENQDLSTTQTNSLLRATKSVEGDFEKERLLKILSTKIKDSVTAQSYLSIVSAMHGDFEKVKSIEHLIKQPVADQVMPGIITAIDELGGDFEKSNLVKKIIDQTKLSESDFERMLALVHNMSGDLEKQNLLKKMTEKNPGTDEVWIALIDEAANMGGDFEKANLLTSIARKMPAHDNIRNAYTRAAKSINSELEYGKTLKALE